MRTSTFAIAFTATALASGCSGDQLFAAMCPVIGISCPGFGEPPEDADSCWPTACDHFCENGQCVDCLEDQDCDGGICDEGRCLDCIDDGDCDGGRICTLSGCAPPECAVDADCGPFAICSWGICEDALCFDGLASPSCVEREWLCGNDSRCDAPDSVTGCGTGDTFVAGSPLLTAGELARRPELDAVCGAGDFAVSVQFQQAAGPIPEAITAFADGVGARSSTPLVGGLAGDLSTTACFPPEAADAARGHFFVTARGGLTSNTVCGDISAP